MGKSGWGGLGRAFIPALVLGVLTGGGCGKELAGADGGASTGPGDARLDLDIDPADEELCRRACDATAALPCPDQPTCLPRCLENLVGALCLPERRGVLECIATNGLAAVMCSDDGRTNFRAGSCEAETDAYLACVGTSSRATGRD